MSAQFTDQIINTVSAAEEQAKLLPRLGLINYINSLPFVLPIMDGQIKIAANAVFAEPAGLNSLYASGQLDLGAMSAFFFLEQGNLNLMPGISIASRGSVGSVLFFSKREIKTYQPLKIAVPAASASAANLLLALLLEEGYAKPVLIPCQQPSLSDDSIDGALIIGDQALVVDQLWSKQYQRIDLGQWWHDIYALPAVFAVFGARKAWHKADNSHTFKTINETLVESAKFGLSEYFDKVLTEAEKKTALPRARLAKYFKDELDYALDANHQLSLHKYEALCRKHGLLK